VTELYQSPHSLKPHPVNGRVYGEAELPEEFLNSVQKLGIIEPIVIRSDNTIISGHRRWAAALKLELKTVPVRTVTFNDELDEIETLIESNRQRVKTTSQIAAEGMELQRIEGERAAQRRRAAQNNESAKAVPQNLGELGESAEHVASALGISAEQWRKLRTVFQKAQSGDAEAKELMKALNAGDISVHKAYRKVREQLSEEQSQHDAERKELIAELNAAKAKVKQSAVPEVVEKEVVREVVPLHVKEQLARLEGDLRTAKSREMELEQSIQDAKKHGKDIESLLSQKSDIQKSLKELSEKNDLAQDERQQALAIVSAARKIREVLNEQKGTIEEASRKGVPAWANAVSIRECAERCYEIGDLLTRATETIDFPTGTEGKYERHRVG